MSLKVNRLQTWFNALDCKLSQFGKIKLILTKNSEYNRFLKPSSNGTDPIGAFNHFISHDIIKPIIKKNIYKSIEYPIPQTWALGTTKKTENVSLLPKIQQLKEYNFSKLNDEEILFRQNNAKKFLKTDHIGIRIPSEIINNKNEEKKFSFLNMKAQYNAQIESPNSWMIENNFPSQINKSSVNYNILNHVHFDNQNNRSYLNKNSFFKRKGVGNFADLTYTFNPNFNPHYEKAFNDNPNIFKSYKGIFSQLYEDAHRNGNIYHPFDLKQIKKSKSSLFEKN